MKHFWHCTAVHGWHCRRQGRGRAAGGLGAVAAWRASEEHGAGRRQAGGRQTPAPALLSLPHSSPRRPRGSGPGCRPHTRPAALPRTGCTGWPGRAGTAALVGEVRSGCVGAGHAAPEARLLRRQPADPEGGLPAQARATASSASSNAAKRTSLPTCTKPALQTLQTKGSPATHVWQFSTAQLEVRTHCGVQGRGCGVVGGSATQSSAAAMEATRRWQQRQTLGGTDAPRRFAGSIRSGTRCRHQHCCCRRGSSSRSRTRTAKQGRRQKLAVRESLDATFLHAQPATCAPRRERRQHHPIVSQIRHCPGGRSRRRRWRSARGFRSRRWHSWRRCSCRHHPRTVAEGRAAGDVVVRQPTGCAVLPARLLNTGRRAAPARFRPQAGPRTHRAVDPSGALCASVLRAQQGVLRLAGTHAVGVEQLAGVRRHALRERGAAAARLVSWNGGGSSPISAGTELTGVRAQERPSPRLT